MVQSLFGSQEKKSGFFDRLKQAVTSTKAQLVERIDEITEGKTTVDPEVLDDLEATLITADLGVSTTGEILSRLRDQVSRRKLREASALRGAVEEQARSRVPQEGPRALDEDFGKNAEQK